jgi:hypothetical protein
VSSSVHSITIDCADPYELGRWWSEVVGRPLADDDNPGDPEALIDLPDGPRPLFVRVPTPTATKT